MKPILVALLAVSLLVTAAAPALAQEGRNPTADEASRRGNEERPTPSGAGRDGNEPDRQNPGENPGRGRDGERGPPANVPIGHFDVDQNDGNATGEFVSFNYGSRGLKNFKADGMTLFDLTPVDGSLNNIDEVEVKGSKVRLTANGLQVVIHDNPGAVSRFESREPIALDFADETQLKGEGRQFGFTLHNVSGKIKADNAEVNGTRLVFSGDLLLLLDNMRAANDDHRPQILEAIGKGHIGAEASFNKRGDFLEEDVVSYGNVTMTTTKAERGNLTILIDGHGFDGRVLVLNVDGRIVGANAADQLKILFDNESIRQADGLADILDPDDDGIYAEYYLLFDPQLEVFQLLVTLPHYSVHTLSVTLVEFLPPPSVVIGIIAGVLVLAPSGYYLFRGPRDSKARR